MAIRGIRGAAAIGAAFLAGCALGGEQYQRDIDTWVGHRADTLLVSWGPPASESVLSDGRRVLLYVKEDLTSVEGGSYFRCDTIFVIGESTIEAANFRGDCSAIYYGGLLNLTRNGLRAPGPP